MAFRHTPRAVILNSVDLLRKLFPRSLARFLLGWLSQWIKRLTGRRSRGGYRKDDAKDSDEMRKRHLGLSRRPSVGGEEVLICGSRVPGIHVINPTPKPTLDLQQPPSSPGPRSSQSSPNLQLNPIRDTDDTNLSQRSEPLHSLPMRSNTPDSFVPNLVAAPALQSRSSSSYLGSRPLSRTPSRAPSRASSRAGSGSGRLSMIDRELQTAERISKRVSMISSQVNVPYRTAPPKPPTSVVRPSPQPTEGIPTPSAHPGGSNVNIPHGSVAVPRGAEDSLSVDIKPILVADIARYAREVKVPKRSEDWTFTLRVHDRYVDAKTVYDVPCGWTACYHPEGALYFYHEDKRILTDADVCKPEIHGTLANSIEVIERALVFSGIEWDEDSELVLELLPSESETPTCGYYFADLKRRTLFWLEDHDVTHLTGEVEGETWLAHINEKSSKADLKNLGTIASTSRITDLSLKISCKRYWVFFCTGASVGVASTFVGSDLTSLDSMTSSYSTFPYHHTDCREMINLLKTIKSSSGGRSACVVSRLMGVFVHQRFLHYHGTSAARLAANQSIYGHREQARKSWRFRMISPLLFYAPEVHLEAIENAWVDRIGHHVLWNKIMSRLQDEWENLSLTLTRIVGKTTVMLTVDISFLAIQSVDVGSQEVNLRCAAQIAIYLSTVASVGSIILGLLLSRQHRAIARDDAEVAQAYLFGKLDASRGLETLAIMYSLPYALLMWAMVTFLLALSGLCFSVNPGVAVTNIGARIPISIAWVCVLALMAWFLHTDWEGREHQLYWEILKRVSSMSKSLSRHISHLSWSQRGEQSEENKLRTFLQKTLVNRTEVGQGSGSQTV
ncbi:hypothetical protein OE88DRAFT_1646661 [Heliocybe sulcata]|uniref:WW domain-containing protein n=1 Tax=Heliocybe sulcata TaxID=5364 RepID=A0A5C3MY44_9AGAM|nr:hypothetical protein OE88DRAFT_1646661 [Heliocybe sulcata]